MIKIKNHTLTVSLLSLIISISCSVPEDTQQLKKIGIVFPADSQQFNIDDQLYIMIKYQEDQKDEIIWGFVKPVNEGKYVPLDFVKNNETLTINMPFQFSLAFPGYLPQAYILYYTTVSSEVDTMLWDLINEADKLYKIPEIDSLSNEISILDSITVFTK